MTTARDLIAFLQTLPPETPMLKQVSTDWRDPLYTDLANPTHVRVFKRDFPTTSTTYRDHTSRHEGHEEAIDAYSF